ncbi:MAG: 30S ribosomal protein S12 methylthiotransferase RimO, partial [Desulfobulbaceae bacterium]|nr:30S ribosomal protein S12 methylthiotransferase RimO [Desulfobulbaceae bacterium]
SSKTLVVTGCLVQRYGQEIVQELPEVDLFIGTDEFSHIAQLIKDLDQQKEVPLISSEPYYLMSGTTARKVSTPFFRAYLKITEGCNNRCSYCMIPSIRGDLRSRSIEDLLVEIRRLEQSGVKELTLIAQDLTAYGNDLDGSVNLEGLLDTILQKSQIPWIRLLYLYPVSINDSLLELMATQSRVLPYFDIPFQHVSDGVLKRMNRRYGMAELDSLIARIRHKVPNNSIRTSLITGFPGETEEDVLEMVECLKRWRLDHVGVFQYADEEGSPAYEMRDKVSDEIKIQRYNRIMEVQAEISGSNLSRFDGGLEEVLVEGVSRESDLLLEGRTRFQAPDIDGCVYIADGTASPGDLVKVRITETHTYDMVGEITGDEER